MARQRKICVITGTRAEYGLLHWLMKGLQSEAGLQLQLIVTGMHLSPEFGLTYQAIEADGFFIDAKVEMLLSSDSPVGVAKSMGLGVIGFADALARLNPDLVVVVGDRYEILAAAQVCLVMKIPLAHIAGGDITEGAFDEAIRHSITKMAHLHFVTNPASAAVVRQLGEEPEYVYNVGNPGLDSVVQLTLLSRAELEKELGFLFRPRNLLITFHPVTLDTQSAGQQVSELLAALDRLGSEVGLIFTSPNSDPEGRQIAAKLEAFVQVRPHARLFPSLGHLKYLSTVAQVDAIVGNSSSGLLEVPSLKKPTVNIGDRQQGRFAASSVLSVKPDADEIGDAIRRAFTLDCSGAVNPYGDGHSSARIIQLLKEIPDYRALLKKRFVREGAL